MARFIMNVGRSIQTDLGITTTSTTRNDEISLWIAQISSQHLKACQQTCNTVTGTIRKYQKTSHKGHDVKNGNAQYYKQMYAIEHHVVWGIPNYIASDHTE